MRRGHRKLWWVVPCSCRSRKSLRTESQKDIEEILETKLATIREEPQMFEENRMLTKHQSIAKKGKKIRSKSAIGQFLMPQHSLKNSYVLFMSGFASKSSLGGLPRC